MSRLPGAGRCRATHRPTRRLELDRAPRRASRRRVFRAWLLARVLGPGGRRRHHRGGWLPLSQPAATRAPDGGPVPSGEERRVRARAAGCIRDRSARPLARRGCDVDLIPAIDMLDGIAVRLVQGDYGRRAASVTDPAPLVRDWLRAGVRWLHLVDLEGARTGRLAHLDLARSLVSAAREAASDSRLELGGGLRRVSDVEAAFDAGIDVAVLGTAAIEDPTL